MVEKRKRELLEQYMTPEFIESMQDTGRLLGVDRTKSSGDVEVEEDEEEEDGTEVPAPMEGIDEQQHS